MLLGSGRSRQARVGPLTAEADIPAASNLVVPMDSSQLSLRRVFQQGFLVQDIARPLISFDDFAPSRQVKEILRSSRNEFAGVRTDGFVTGIVEFGDLAEANCGQFARPVDGSLLVTDRMPLAELVLRLNDQPRLFVSALGQICGVVSRLDLHQPPARMWLFGMITLLEMRFTRLIELQCPEEAWRSSISAGRLQKAEALQSERRRVKQDLSLLDCLQFSDKAQIVARNEELRQSTRFQSRRQVEDVGKRLEKLRNNLAHAQDIVTSDWPTIVELVENLDAVLEGPAATTIPSNLLSPHAGKAEVAPSSKGNDEVKCVAAADARPTAAGALARLVAGNERFVQGETNWTTMPREALAGLAQGQHPFATVLGCSDSRVPPERVFDAGVGELFVIRVAGNVLSPEVAGSIQYAASHLNTPLFVVLGHEGCGAVAAALAAKHQGAEFRSHIEKLLESIVPGLPEFESSLSGAERLSQAVEANVRWTVNQILNSPEGQARLAEGRMKIVGAIYDIQSGHVRWLPPA